MADAEAMLRMDKTLLRAWHATKSGITRLTSTLEYANEFEPTDLTEWGRLCKLYADCASGIASLHQLRLQLERK